MQTMIRQRGALDLVMLVIGLIALAGIVAVATVAWHTFTESYRDEGRAEVRGKYAPIIAECEKRKIAPAACVDAWLAADRDRAQANMNLNRCTEGATAQNAAVDAATKRADDAQAMTRQILAELAKKSKATQAEIDKLKAIAATPAASRKESCDAADDVLRALAARRLRFDPGTPAGAGPQGAGDSGAGGGALRVR